MSESKPLARRLREAAEAGRSPILGHLHVDDHLKIEAANEIERLTAKALMFDSVFAQAEALKREQVRLREALLSLLPGLELDLRYADADDDTDAMRSRITTVREALAPEAPPVSPSRPSADHRDSACLRDESSAGAAGHSHETTGDQK